MKILISDLTPVKNLVRNNQYFHANYQISDHTTVQISDTIIVQIIVKLRVQGIITPRHTPNESTAI
jgi:hypothetical protein